MSNTTPTITVRTSLARLLGFRFRVRNLAAVAAVMALAAPAVDAAVQGTRDFNTSSGSIEIDLLRGFQARITGLADLPLGVWSGTGSLSANDNVCIGTNNFSGLYRIRASGDGEPGDPSAFTLSNGASQITYSAFYNDVTNAGSGRTLLTGGVTLTGQTGNPFEMWFNGSPNCRFENGNISVEVPETELSGATGTYNGTLTLLLLPE